MSVVMSLAALLGGMGVLFRVDLRMVLEGLVS